LLRSGKAFTGIRYGEDLPMADKHIRMDSSDLAIRSILLEAKGNEKSNFDISSAGFLFFVLPEPSIFCFYLSSCGFSTKDASEHPSALDIRVIGHGSSLSNSISAVRVDSEKGISTQMN
jgi:hypothetical protein